MAVLGALYALRATMRLLWGLGGGLCAFILAPLGLSRINLKKYGSWAGKSVVVVVRVMLLVCIPVYPPIYCVPVL